MRRKKRSVVFAASLLALGTVWLGLPPPANAGPAMAQGRLVLDLSESGCVRRAQQSVSSLKRIDSSIRTDTDDDTVWVANDSFTGMIACLGRGDRTLAVIVVASGSRSLSSATKDNLKRGMD